VTIAEPGKTMNTSLVGRRRSKRFSGGALMLLAAALLVSGTFHKPASGATLQALLSGGSLTVGNSIFSDWQLLSLDSTTGVNLDLSLLNVNPLAGDPSNPGLQFASASQLSVTGINAINLLVQFRVDALSGSNSFTAHTLSLTGISFGSDGGIAYISDEMTSHVGADLGPALVIVDNVSDVTQLVSTSSFSPQSGLSVVTNVFLTGLSSSDSINLISFTQRFSQSGVPVLAGDYNKNGTVDAADYVVWRKNDGTPAGYTAWRTHFGQSTGSSSGASADTAVPEPATFVLLIVTAGSYFRRCRRHRKSINSSTRDTGHQPTVTSYSASPRSVTAVPRNSCTLLLTRTEIDSQSGRSGKANAKPRSAWKNTN
jgi:hypothetical protein